MPVVAVAFSEAGVFGGEKFESAKPLGGFAGVEWGDFDPGEGGVLGRRKGGFLVDEVVVGEGAGEVDEGGPLDGLGLAGGDGVGASRVGRNYDVVGHCIYNAENWGEDCDGVSTSMIHATDSSIFVGERGAGRGDQREGGVCGGDDWDVQGQNGRTDSDE